jgi:hypothetical protein
MACENKDFVAACLYKSQRWQSPGKNRREFFRGLNVKRAGLLPRHRQPLNRMKIDKQPPLREIWTAVLAA